MEKTKYELKAEVQQTTVKPKTLQPEAQMMNVSGAMTPLYAVYGSNDEHGRVWVATFFDVEESQAWCMASKQFGRAVRGAVIAQQEKSDEETARDAKIAQIRDDLRTGKLVKVEHEDGSASLYDGPNADKPN